MLVRPWYTGYSIIMMTANYTTNTHQSSQVKPSVSWRVGRYLQRGQPLLVKQPEAQAGTHTNTQRLTLVGVTRQAALVCRVPVHVLEQQLPQVRG